MTDNFGFPLKNLGGPDKQILELSGKSMMVLGDIQEETGIHWVDQSDNFNILVSGETDQSALIKMLAKYDQCLQTAKWGSLEVKSGGHGPTVQCLTSCQNFQGAYIDLWSMEVCRSSPM